MEAESFFARWAKHNADAAEKHLAETPVPPAHDAQPAPLVDEVPKPPPTLEDVAQLTPDSDFKPFVARGIDEDVRRSAMKKLFADPQFNVMDGLDVYIEDYNTFEPIPAAMLAQLNHAQALLNPLAHLENSLMRLITADDEKDEPDPQIAQAPSVEVPPQGTDNHGEVPPTEEQVNNDDPV